MGIQIVFCSPVLLKKIGIHVITFYSCTIWELHNKIQLWSLLDVTLIPIQTLSK